MIYRWTTKTYGTLLGNHGKSLETLSYENHQMNTSVGWLYKTYFDQLLREIGPELDELTSIMENKT